MMFKILLWLIAFAGGIISIPIALFATGVQRPTVWLIAVPISIVWATAVCKATPVNLARPPNIEVEE